MLDEDGDAVGFRIQLAKEFFIGDLLKGAVGKPLMALHLVQGFFEVVSG